MNKKILIIAPHPDDETISSGGTIAKYAAQGYEVTVLTVSGHLPPLYKRDDYDRTEAEAKKAYEVLGVKDYIFLEIPATMVSNEPTHILNKKICDVVNKLSPQIVFIPFIDRHQDHNRGFFGRTVQGQEHYDAPYPRTA